MAHDLLSTKRVSFLCALERVSVSSDRVLSRVDHHESSNSRSTIKSNAIQYLHCIVWYNTYILFDVSM